MGIFSFLSGKKKKKDANTNSKSPTYTSDNYLQESGIGGQIGNEAVESLRSTGQLPNHYLTKAEAGALGWEKGRAVGNFTDRKGQIGGDIFYNDDLLLPVKPGRTWFEADIGLNNMMKRSKQHGTRLLYSSDGLLYVTGNHYKSFHYLGTY